MEDRTAKELIKALDANTKAVKSLEKFLRRQSTEPVDPAQPAGTEKLNG